MSRRRPVLSGHMKKAIDRLESLSGTVNLVLEVVDARAPRSTRCDIVTRVLTGCRSVTVFSKADLADPAATDKWVRHLGSWGERAIVFPFGKQKKRKKFIEDILESSGVSGGGEQVKAVVAGLPNVGKSTILNTITGRKRARVGARPGITRGLQLVTIRNDFMILDTPGVISSSIADREQELVLALVGCLQESGYDTHDAADFILSCTLPDYPELLSKHYDIEDMPGDPLSFYEAVARRRGFLQKGGMLDIDRVMPILLRDFSTGKLRGVTLERPDDQP